MGAVQTRGAMSSKQVRAANDQVSSRRKTTTMWVDGRDGKYPLPWSRVLPLGLLGGAAVIGLSTVLVVPGIESDLTAETIADLERAGIETSSVDVDYSYRSGVVHVARGVTPEAVLDAVSFSGIRDLDVVRSSTEPASDEQASDTANTVAAATTAPPAARSTTTGSPTTASSTTASPTTASPTTASPTTAAGVGTASTTGESAATATSTLASAPAPPAGGEVRVIWVGGKLTLTGTVASEDQRKLLVDAATASVGGAAVEDQLRVTGSPSPTDQQVVSLASILAEAPSLTSATFLLIGGNLSVTGDAATAVNAGVVELAAEGLTAVAGSASIGVAGPPSVALDELRAGLAALAPEFAQTVVFASGRSELNEPARAVLDKIVALLQQYPAPVVTIVGHTDNRGGRSANQRLSEARSAVVLDYLVSRGIDPARLRSAGSGETFPIADNATDEGRHRNRRVDLVAADGF